MPHDIFISYSSKDKTIADAVCAKLEERKIRCWMAPRDIPVGQNFAKSIIYAINESKVFVLVWSAHTNTSEHILNEINQAFDQGITIIPFRIEDVQPTVEMRYYFGRTHWLDALTPPLEKHIGILAQSITAVLASKRDGSPEQVNIKEQGSTHLKDEPADKIVEPVSPQGYDQITDTAIQEKSQEESMELRPPGASSLKNKRLISIIGIFLVASALVTMSFLGVFKGITNPSGHKPAGSSASPTLGITLTPIRLIPSSSATKANLTETPTRKYSVTPNFLWATEFSGQILTAMKYRDPDFSDDFSYWKTDWWMNDWRGDPVCKNTLANIVDGKLVMSANIGCGQIAKLRSLKLHNFAVQVDMDLTQTDSEGTVTIRGATDLQDIFIILSHDGTWRVFYSTANEITPMKSGKLTISKYDYPVTITVIFNGAEMAIFVKSIPLYHDKLNEPVSVARYFEIGVEGATENSPIRVVEFDNLKIWDLDKIEGLSVTTTKAK